MDSMWETLQEFVVDYCDYLPDSIPELDKFPTPNEFLNNYVLTNLPFVVRCDESQHFPAVLLWKDPKYMRKKMAERKVTVAVTPDGRADSIVDDLFMIPEERTMLFDKFYDELHMRDINQVYYLQKQNNNLIEEFSPLVDDVASHIPWVTEAFIHKDHYENIYCVITGQKKFYLYPPVSVAWMPYQKFKKFQWYYEGVHGREGKWHMKDLNEEVKWILPSHQPQTRNQFKMLLNTKSYVVDVCPGDVLYLPAMWFHEVHQTDKCIAVNYWYDMKFDMKYPFLKLLDKLCRLRTPRRDASVDKQIELEDSLLSDLHEKQKKLIKEELKLNRKFGGRVPKQ
ncbi:unnamed protein product [Larinioides sclopetarius]|uniref:JmjC domain-containing protein n=1 Tax=Larinioides sclopetarius TaxID=280406 RepID=A0AAV1Z0G8_9ARAC